MPKSPLGFIVNEAIKLVALPLAIGLSLVADLLLGAEECPHCGASIDTCQKIL